MPVARGTVLNTVTVDGTVAADAAVPVKATAAGTVRRLLVAPGATVTAGQALLEIRSETPRPPVTGTDAEGNPDRHRARAAWSRHHRDGARRPARSPRWSCSSTRSSPSATPPARSPRHPVGHRDADPGRTSSGCSSPPATAEVDVQGGPAPFTCTGLTLGAAPAGSDPAGRRRRPADSVQRRRRRHRRHHGALLGPAGHHRLRRAWPPRSRSQAGDGRRTCSSCRSPPSRGRCRPATSGSSPTTATPEERAGHPRADRRRADRGARGPHRGRDGARSSCRWPTTSPSTAATGMPGRARRMTPAPAAARGQPRGPAARRQPAADPHRRRPRPSRRGARLDRRPVRVGQVDAAQPARAARQPDGRGVPARRRAHRPAARPGGGPGCAGRRSASCSSSSTCCPGGPRLENVAAPLLYARGRRVPDRAAGRALRDARPGRPGRPGGHDARAALRRRAAAGRHRPGAGPPSPGGPGRRAHRRPRRRDRRAR